MPIGTPTISARAAAIEVNSSVACTFPKMIWPTGRCCWQERPKSPRTARPANREDCTTKCRA